jgi:serine protease
VLVNERKPAGEYEVKFDGSGLSSGVYIYRLTTGEGVSSRRMLLIR